MERVIKAKLKKQNKKPLLSVPVYQKKKKKTLSVYEDW